MKCPWVTVLSVVCDVFTIPLSLSLSLSLFAQEMLSPIEQ